MHCAMGTEKSNVKERVLTNMSVVGLGCEQHVVCAGTGGAGLVQFQFQVEFKWVTSIEVEN